MLQPRTSHRPRAGEEAAVRAAIAASTATAKGDAMTFRDSDEGDCFRLSTRCSGSLLYLLA